MPTRRPTADRRRSLLRRTIAALTASRPRLETGGTLTLVAASADIVATDITPNAASDDTQTTPGFTLNAYSGGVMYPLLAGVEWRGPVVVDISGIETDGVVPVHREHNPDRPVGHATVSLNSGRITAEGLFSVPGEDTDTVLTAGRRGFPWKASIGLGDMRYQRITAGNRVTVNGRQFDGPILVVRAARLNEISFVTIGGDSQTSAAVAASFAPGVSDMNFAAWVQSLGIQLNTLSASAVTQLRTSYNALLASGSLADDGGSVATLDPGDDDDNANISGSASDPGDSGGDGGGDGAGGDNVAPAPGDGGDDNGSLTATRGNSPGLTAGSNRDLLTAMRTAAAAEEGRITAIRAIGERFGDPAMADGQSLVAHAITEGLSVQQATLMARRLSRPAAPAIHTTSVAQRGTTETLQAAIMLRAGRAIDTRLTAGAGSASPAWLARPVNDPDRQRIMDGAQEFRDHSMIELIHTSLQASGHNVPSARNRHAVLQAGFSTNAVSAIFTQSVGAIALMAYAEAADFSLGWCSEQDALNLVETDRPRMVAAPDLTLHETDGESDHVSRAATNEKVKVDRYSRQAAIDEIDFINDNFGLLAETPRDFGRAAARLRPNMVAAVMLANANLAATGRALFNTTDISLIASNALSQANLQKARAALAKRRDGDANLNLQASHLIVPSDLGDLAIQLTQSAVITNDSGAGGMNPTYMRNIQPRDEGRLATGVTDPKTGASLAGSLTSWYLVAADAHTIEVQYLQGTGRVPIVVVEQLPGGKFGLSIVVKHFIGAKALDFRGMVRNDA